MMNRIVLSLGLLAFSLAACAQNDQADKYQEGVHYFKVPQASAPAESDSVTVTEVFSYACSHCNTFEPYLQNWKKAKPDYVKFDRIPVAFGRRAWELLARGYIAADMMGIADMSHVAMMDAIWKEHKQFRSIDELADFYAGFGVDKKAFIANYNSFAADSQMRRGQRDVRVFGVTGTPTLIVDRKYRVTANKDVPSLDAMIDVMNWLAEREHNQTVQASATR